MTMSDYQASAGISKHLSKLASSYTSDPSLFVADQVAVPYHSIDTVSFNFQRNRGAWSDITATLRAKGSPVAMMDAEDDALISGLMEEHGLARFVSERDFQLRGQAGYTREEVIEGMVKEVTGALMISKEYQLAQMLTTSGNYNASNSAAASAYWTPGTTGTDPIADVAAAIKQIMAGPCVGGEFYMVADEGTWEDLRNNAQIRSACGGILLAPSIEEVGHILGVHPVVCKAKYNSSSPMYGANAIVYKRPVDADIRDQSANCSFRCITNIEQSVEIRTKYDDDRDGLIVKGRSFYKLINPYGDSNDKFNAAFLITGVHA